MFDVTSRSSIQVDATGHATESDTLKSSSLSADSRKANETELSALVLQKRVEARCHKKDRYGREVCAVLVSLRDVGLEQIRQGMAWHYKEYQHEQMTHDRLVYRDEEKSAKARRVGLWKDAKPVPPWERRRRENGD